jgi:hypothetical protein
MASASRSQKERAIGGDTMIALFKASYATTAMQKLTNHFITVIVKLLSVEAGTEWCRSDLFFRGGDKIFWMR